MVVGDGGMIVARYGALLKKLRQPKAATNAKIVILPGYFFYSQTDRPNYCYKNKNKKQEMEG
jgi:hypothetical protein